MHAAPAAALPATDFRALFETDAIERVRLVKRGMPARTLDDVARRMAVPKERLAATLGLARATVDRKAREDRLLSPDESSRLLGIARLVGQVQAMVEGGGNGNGSGSSDTPFDAAGWVARWLEAPLPALGGERPATLMDTPDGQALVAQLAARMESGAFS